MGDIDNMLYYQAPRPGKRLARNEPRIQVQSIEYWQQYSKSTLPQWMLLFNVLGAIAHGVGVGIALGVARRDFRLSVWRVQPVNLGNITDPNMSAQIVFEGIELYPTTIITAFFGLSLTFHTIISCFLTVHLIAGPGEWTNWYMKGLYHCKAWWRWIEYFFSASLMLLLTCLLLGLRMLHVIWMVVGLMGITITFGWATELHSSNLIMAGADPYEFMGWTLTRRWLPGSWKTRLQIHLLGYLPYALLWGIVFDQFRVNMDVIGDTLPAFVNVSTIGSFSLFTLFGLVQFANQVFEYGPSLYWLGEATYVVLSFTAKANLGFIVIYQALVEGSPYDEALGVNRDHPAVVGGGA